MAKQSGLGDNLYIDGFNLSGDIGSLSRIGGGPTALELTGIDKSAVERLGGIRDGAIEFSSFFNDAAGQSHPRLKLLPTTDVNATYARGTALGGQAACVVAKQINYDPNRAQDGSLTFAIQCLANGTGLEWGNQLTAGQRTDTAATNGASVDFGVGPTVFGLQAWLHVFAFTGTDVTVALQESSDDGAGDAFAAVAGGGFATVITAPGSQRILTGRNQTVERYLRVVTTTVGGFSNLVFSVVVKRNDVSVVF